MTHAPGKGGGYIARNKRPPRNGKESPLLTGKVSITCQCGAHQDYFVDGYQKQRAPEREGDRPSVFYSLRLKAIQPKAKRQPGQGSEGRPGGSEGRPGGDTAQRPPNAASERPGSADGGRPGSDTVQRPGG